MHCSKCGVENPDGVDYCSACGNPLAASSVPGPAGSGVIYANFGKRAAAALIDAVLLFVIGSVFGFLMTVVEVILPARVAENVTIFLTLLALALNLLYYPLMESSARQATLGKMAVGIIVTDTDGNRVSYGRAVGRYLAKFLSLLLLGIGFIIAAFTEKRQALHDMIAKTLVVNRE